MKLYLDPGHGGTDSGAVGNGLMEKNINLDIALRIRNILKDEYENVDIKMSRTSDKFISLGGRTQAANSWGADFFLSIHVNSSNGKGKGYEDYIYNELSRSSRTAHIQDIIHKEVMKVNNLVERGQKKASYHVLRESKMVSMLTENGFIDNTQDANLMKQPAWREKVARGHANGLAKAFNLKQRKGQSDGSKGVNSVNLASGSAAGKDLIKVYSGSFLDRSNAEDRVKELKKHNVDSFIVEAQISGKTWYRVQVGAFTVRKVAEDKLKEVQKLGYDDSFIVD